ncbi:TPA: hypothetical protein HA241_03235 [Candidatus Woesearchaeota archaeon]|nr:hypothetical protein [Candidatus Woesearchaeota archaeon]
MPNQYWRQTDLKTVHTGSHGSIISIYDPSEVRERLERYHVEGLISTDLDGTLKSSVALRMALEGMKHPRHALRNMYWVFRTMAHVLYQWTQSPHSAFSDAVVLAQPSSFEKWVNSVYHLLSAGEQEQVLSAAQQPYFPRMDDVMRHLGASQGIVVSRNIHAVVAPVTSDLGFVRGYSQTDNKGNTILRHAAEGDIQRICHFGDTPDDLRVGDALRADGKKYDLIAVCRSLDPRYCDRRATIFMPQDGRPLAEFLGI